MQKAQTLSRSGLNTSGHSRHFLRRIPARNTHVFKDRKFSGLVVRHTGQCEPESVFAWSNEGWAVIRQLNRLSEKRRSFRRGLWGCSVASFNLTPGWPAAVLDFPQACTSRPRAATHSTQTSACSGGRRLRTAHSSQGYSLGPSLRPGR